MSENESESEVAEARPDTMWVRLQPYNPKKGFVLQDFSVLDTRFRADGGWYEVPTDMAEYLATVHERMDDESSPLAFVVLTEVEAHALEERERLAREALLARATAPRLVETPAARAVKQAGTLTTGDLPRPRPFTPQPRPVAPAAPAPVPAEFEEPAASLPAPAPASAPRRVSGRGPAAPARGRSME
jgi:hypothetical protein